MQMLFSEYGKIDRLEDLSASFSSASTMEPPSTPAAAGLLPKREALSQH